MSVLFFDSNSELWYTKADELGLTNLIGMPYNIDDEDEQAYDLGRNTDFDAFFNKVKAGSTARTSALNVQNYIDYFEPVLARGEDILYVHFSSAMSGTFEYMKQAIELLKEKYPDRKIQYVDTLRISIGEGLIVYDVAKMWKNGATDEEIIDYVEKERLKYNVNFVVDDLKHLKRGGRLSTTSCVFGTLLNIKPILCVSDEGMIIKQEVAKGKKKALVQLFEKTKNADINHAIVITHAQAEDEAKELFEMIKDYFSGQNVEMWIQPIGPTVGTHCGAGTVGVAFKEKTEKEQ